jgi:hypothetical protein
LSHKHLAFLDQNRIFLNLHQPVLNRALIPRLTELMEPYIFSMVVLDLFQSLIKVTSLLAANENIASVEAVGHRLDLRFVIPKALG